MGARCKDNLSGEQVEVYAKVVINATGTLTDSIRKQSDAGATKCVTGSSGAHVTLPSFYGSEAMGLIIPKTRDGRVLFLLPWQVGARSCAHLSTALAAAALVTSNLCNTLCPTAHWQCWCQLLREHSPLLH